MNKSLYGSVPQFLHLYKGDVKSTQALFSSSAFKILRRCTQEAPPLRSGCQVKACSPPAPLSPELGSWLPQPHRVLLVHVDLGRQDGHGRAAAGTLAGTGPEVRLAGVGAVLLQGAPGAPGAGQDPGRWGGSPPPRPPGPSLRPRSLTASPGRTSRSRRRPRPRSPRRWCARRTRRPSPWPSGDRGGGPAQRGGGGGQPGEGRRGWGN